MHEASDGKTRDNGYGIMLIPENILLLSKWDTTSTSTSGYLNSYMNKTTLVTVANNLKTVLGNHLVNRNVLLSSSVNNNGGNAYTWTTAYCTLMSGAQLKGELASYSTRYDDGEANYKLPLFNYIGINIGEYAYWIRGSFGSDSANANYYVHIVHTGSNSIGAGSMNYDSGVRPLIYIR